MICIYRRIRKHTKPLIKVTTEKMARCLWYLLNELVAFSLFDDVAAVSITEEITETKRRNEDKDIKALYKKSTFHLPA